MKSLRLLAVLPVMALVLAGCSQQPTVTTESTPVAMEETQLEGTTPMSDIESSPDAMMEKNADFTVESSNFEFSVPEMKVKAGQTVTVKLVNTEGTHDFVIDEITGAKTELLEGEGEDTITFTVPADAKGKTFEYYCSYMKHREMGMVGKMIVE